MLTEGTGTSGTTGTTSTGTTSTGTTSTGTTGTTGTIMSGFSHRNGYYLWQDSDMNGWNCTWACVSCIGIWVFVMTGITPLIFLHTGTSSHMVFQFEILCSLQANGQTYSQTAGLLLEMIMCSFVYKQLIFKSLGFISSCKLLGVTD